MSFDKVNAPHIPVTLLENDLQTGAIKILQVIRPGWKEEDIKMKLLTDGLTNKLIGCNLDGLQEEETVLIRVYGNKTDLLIDRKAETRNIIFLNNLRLAPDLYATFDNGLAYQYVPGRTLTVDSVRDPKLYRLVAKRMAQLHKAGNSELHSHEPFIWEKIQQFFNTVPEQFSDNEKQKRFQEICPSLKEIDQEIKYLKEKLENLSNPVVFAHNDLLLANVIYTEETNSVSFIDYEYAAYNYQAFDIGNHFAEFSGVDVTDYSRYPDKHLQIDWLTSYLTEYNGTLPKESELQRLYIHVNQFGLLTHLFWGIWSLIQTEHSEINFDYLGYAAIRFNEYFAKKNEYLSMKCGNN